MYEWNRKDKIKIQSKKHNLIKIDCTQTSWMLWLTRNRSSQDETRIEQITTSNRTTQLDVLLFFVVVFVFVAVLGESCSIVLFFTRTMPAVGFLWTCKTEECWFVDRVDIVRRGSEEEDEAALEWDFAFLAVIGCFFLFAAVEDVDEEEEDDIAAAAAVRFFLIPLNAERICEATRISSKSISPIAAFRRNTSAPSSAVTLWPHLSRFSNRFCRISRCFCLKVFLSFRVSLILANPLGQTLT